MFCSQLKVLFWGSKKPNNKWLFPKKVGQTWHVLKDISVDTSCVYFCCKANRWIVSLSFDALAFSYIKVHILNV